jgi:hypothetical protein
MGKADPHSNFEFCGAKLAPHKKTQSLTKHHQFD